MKVSRVLVAAHVLFVLVLGGCGESETSPPASGADQGAAEGAPGRTIQPTVPLVSLRIGATPFEIARPASWVEGPVSGESVLESWIPPEVELYPNLNVTLETLPSPGEAGVEQVLDGLVRSLPGFQLLEADWQEINGIRGLRSTSAWPSIFGGLAALRMMIPWEGKVVVISFVDFARDWDHNAPVFNQCVDALAPFQPVEVKSPANPR